MAKKSLLRMFFMIRLILNIMVKARKNEMF